MSGNEFPCITVLCLVSYHSDWILEIPSCFAVIFPLFLVFLDHRLNGILLSMLVYAIRSNCGGAVSIREDLLHEQQKLGSAGAPNLRQTVESRFSLAHVLNGQKEKFAFAETVPGVPEGHAVPLMISVCCFSLTCYSTWCPV